MEGVLCFWSRTPTLTPTPAVPEAATESTGLEADGARIVLDTMETEEEPAGSACRVRDGVAKDGTRSHCGEEVRGVEGRHLGSKRTRGSKGGGAVDGKAWSKVAVKELLHEIHWLTF